MKEIISEKYGELKKLESSIYDINATIKVKGTIYPGVKIKIGEYELIVPKQMHNVIFYKDREAGEIKWGVDLK